MGNALVLNTRKGSLRVFSVPVLRYSAEILRYSEHS